MSKKGRHCKTNAAQNIAIKNLKDSGASVEDIATAVGISKSTVYIDTIRGDLELTKKQNRQLQLEKALLQGAMTIQSKRKNNVN